MSDIFCERVYAKVNLSLAITGKRDDLHTIDMIVCPYHELFDEVSFSLKKDTTDIEIENIQASFEGFEEERFLAFYMPKVRAIAKKFGVGGTLSVQKNIPLGAGLGGSTASVVAALKAVGRYFASIGRYVLLDEAFLLSLGSDVRCMHLGRACRVQGVGEVLSVLFCEIPNDITVRIAEGGSDSGKCYAEYDRLRAGKHGDAPIAADIHGALSDPRNDLTEAAVSLNPNIGKLIAEMKKEFDFVVMSGSGSAVVGIGKKQM